MIELHEVGKRFGRQQVLSGVNLRLAEGERVALIGHNGSGKTTLMRCLLGLYRCEGQIRIQGLDPRKDRQRLLAQVGFVPQQAPGLRATVAQYLMAIHRLCGVERAQIREVAAALGLALGEIDHKPFHALSGGMKQKLLIAVALARQPRLLIMDEPAANLDPVARAAFFQQLEALSPRATLLLSSHRINEISGLVTRLVELDSGQVVLDDLVSVSGGGLGRAHRCALTLYEPPGATVEAALAEWGLRPDAARLRWRGPVAAADRFRFLSLIARWAGLVEAITLQEDNDDE